MPVKHVYGKRVRRPATFGASAFSWSSPDKSPIKITTIEDETLEEITVAVKAIALHGGRIPNNYEGQKSRTALGARDANSVVRQRPLHPPTTKEDVKQDVRRSPRIKKRHDSPMRLHGQDVHSPTRRQPRLSAEGTTPHEKAYASPLETIPVRHDSITDGRPESGARDAETDVQEVKEDDTSDTACPTLQSLLDLTHDALNQKGPIPFGAWTAGLDNDFTLSKIAEASFAQVYLLQRKEPTGNSREDQSVLKVISLHPAALAPDVRDTRPPKVKETSSAITKVVSEVKVLDRMTEIPGFTNLRDVSVLSGHPSAPFVSTWKEWNKKRRKNDKSFFPDPSRKANYGEDQLWAVIEMDHAGFDLEHPDTKIEDVESLWDVFWGVAITLAKGEEDVRFEHRDLHLGNVCVTRKDIDRRVQQVRKLGTSGLETTIIDYTLSRADIEVTAGARETVYVDLDAEGIFDGDASVHYQYDLYRYMRSAVHLGDPLSDVSNAKQDSVSWQDSHLETNVLWLHFLLRELQPLVLDGFDRDDLIRTKKLALGELLGLLRLEEWANHKLRSAKDVVLLALERGWLDPEDVSGDALDVEDVASKLGKLDLSTSRDLTSDAVSGTEESRSQKPPKGRRKKNEQV